MECEVVVWLDDLSDGSKCYAAVFPALNHANRARRYRSGSAG